MFGITSNYLATVIAVSCLAGLFVSPGAAAQRPDTDLSTASLEELTQMHISVSSFARKKEDLWKTPAAIFVITRDDIARSAVSSIPELLRMVPGMQVAQIDASSWAVSARGFNSAYADKLLLLIDGRTVYSEIYSGANWDEIDLPLDEIERIEVIRGPGAAVWGTNAVNGVVNIITRKARTTVGPSASNTLSRIGETVDLQYAGAMGERAQYRASTSYIQRNSFDLGSSARAFDGADAVRVSGRLDWQKTLSDLIMTSADLYAGNSRQQVRHEVQLPTAPNGHDSESIAGGHMLSRWDHTSQGSDMALQLYYDDKSEYEIGGHLSTRTIDVDYQDHLTEGPHHDLVWGSEFRFTADQMKAPENNPIQMVLPRYRNYLADGFVQDEIAVVPEHLSVTIGTKIQDGTLAGFQLQPSGRILWAPSKVQSLWAAVSRAVVAPSIQDKYLAANLVLGVEGGLPITGTLNGNPMYKPETLVAYELGYRRRIGSTLTFDLATFANCNRRLQSVSVVSAGFEPTPAPHIATELLYTNGYRANTFGIEASASWKPIPALSMQASYGWMEARTQVDPGLVSILDSWNTPRNTFAGSASWSFAPRWTANGFLSHVGVLSSNDGLSLGPTLQQVPNVVLAYTRLDLHLARSVGRFIVFDAGGTNLLTPRHFEFGDGAFITPSQVPRSAFVKAIWSF